MLPIRLMEAEAGGPKTRIAVGDPKTGTAVGVPTALVKPTAYMCAC